MTTAYLLSFTCFKYLTAAIWEYCVQPKKSTPDLIIWESITYLSLSLNEPLIVTGSQTHPNWLDT